MTYYTLTLDALAASTLDELATMEMGRPPLVVPWHSCVVYAESDSKGFAPSRDTIAGTEISLHVI